LGVNVGLVLPTLILRYDQRRRTTVLVGGREAEFRTAWKEWRIADEAMEAARRAMVPEGWTPRHLGDVPQDVDTSDAALCAFAAAAKPERAARRRVTRIARGLGIKLPLVPPHLGGRCTI